MKYKNIYIIIILLIFIGCIIIVKENIRKSYAVGNTLADTVKALSNGTSWDAGASGVYYTNSHEYRYVGANVNNYVKFNNDMYRIIGVFDEYSHGKSSNLVKLVRARSLGSYSWGVSNTSNNSGEYSKYANDWTGKTTASPSNLNVLLNEYFYNKTDTSETFGNCSDWSYYYGENKTKNCSSLIKYGILPNFQGYIETVTWYLYGYDSYKELSKEKWYECERGHYASQTGVKGSADSSQDAKIGLMYLSDYLYASGYYASSDTTSSISSSYFSSNNWLYKGIEWFLTPWSYSSENSWCVTNRGFTATSVTYGLSIRPTFYLKSSVYVTGGNGSFDNPFTLGCDNCN